jgi:D-serine deaminase-like pyridoxal phosphate-dependent protein
VTIHELDTPALVIDLDIMERNLARVASYAKEHSLRLRPHTKTHKSPEIGRRQLDLGAAGLTVAKTTEGEVMLNSGTPDLLIAYPVVGPKKVARAVELAHRTYVTVALDSFECARTLSEAAQAAGVGIGVLVEFDAGLRRAGVPPEDVLPLVKSVSSLPNILWEGLAFYPGHIKALDDTGRVQLSALQSLVPRLVESLEKEGLPPRIVSGGSTPLLWQSHLVPGLNEIRPGTYVFNDRNTLRMGACAMEDCAATIHATVVTAQNGRAMIDGGSKTFSSDGSTAPDAEGYGEVLDAPGARFHRMNEEHGYLDTAQCDRTLKVGDRVRVLMNHVCTSVNLQERIYGVRGETVEEIFEVEGRGKLQ